LPDRRQAADWSRIETTNRQRLLLLLVSLIAAGALAGRYVELRAEPVDQVAVKWAASGHSSRGSASFTHWDEDDPPLVPGVCAD
jgi:hypothetical protein